MRTNRMICALLFGLAFTLMTGCAGGLPPQELKMGSSASAPANGQTVADLDKVTGMEFVFVKGGCYQMGDTFGDGDKDERPVHEVCVSDFYLGKYEVTQSQWEKVMGKNLKADDLGSDFPISNVSWNMAQEFVHSLNSKSGLQYRLPTEAEWEYAARSGGKREKWAGTIEKESLGDFAWYYDNYNYLPHRVGLKKPNGLGLYDMSGNVAEWCRDWYQEVYYAESPKDNPVGPATGEKRVVRGGGPYDSRGLSTSGRMSDPPDTIDGDYGFRLLRPGK